MAEPVDPITIADLSPPGRACEVVGLFGDPHAAEAGVQDLLTSGFEHRDLAILAGRRTVADALGHRPLDSVAAADDLRLPRRAWIEPESRVEGQSALAATLGYAGAVAAIVLAFSAGGAMAVAIAGALVAGGLGGGLGAVLGRLLDRRLVRDFQQQMAGGGILVWVRIRPENDEHRALDILRRHGARHAHVHPTCPA